MKFKKLLIFTLSLSVFISCVKHEVIPPPEIKVTLVSKFTGTINGASIEYNEGVDNYTCIPTQDKNILASPSLSSAIYYSEILSSTYKNAIRIGLGKINWDAGSSSDPSVDVFNSFFTTSSNVLPHYKDNCMPGFNVRYTDEVGTIYTSRDTSSQFQNVKFSNMAQESDPNGDYSKFLCTFNCYVYYASGPAPAVGLDSIQIQNAQFKGWFKK
jgi:hypothetical protein